MITKLLVTFDYAENTVSLFDVSDFGNSKELKTVKTSTNDAADLLRCVRLYGYRHMLGGFRIDKPVVVFNILKRVCGIENY